ncbi:MAG: hypothetical protein PUF10_02855 [Bacteroidales bacterium]|nr:hypothetical protein [Bacteroidales bacterium]
MDKENLTEDEKKSLEVVKSMIEDNLKTKGFVSGEDMVNAIKEVKAQFDKTKTEMETKSAKDVQELTETITGLNKTVAEMSGKIEAYEKGATMNMAKKSAFRQSLDEALESDKFKQFANGDASKKSGTFELKGIHSAIKIKGVVSQTNNLTTANGTAYAYQSDEVVPEVNISRMSLRSLIPSIDATEEEFTSWAYQQITDIDRAAAAVSENGVLPEGSFKIKEVLTETKRIGWHLPISKRMLKRRMLGDYINNLMPAGMVQQENFQLLYGDDSNVNFKGLVKYASTESALTADIYDEAGAAGKVNSIESWDNGAATKINFVQGYPKIETGMIITCSGFQTATSLNAAKTLTKYNDNSVIVPVSYTPETNSSVLANAKFKVANSWTASVPNANVGDAISIALAYLMIGTYVPTAIIMNPIDYASFTAIKDVANRRMFNEYVTVSNGIPYFAGIYPIILMPDIAKGKILIGDFARGCKIIDTQAGSLEFAEDVDTKLKNMVEAIIQEEVIFEVSVPQTFMYVDIATLISAITTTNPIAANVNSTIVSPLSGDGEVLVKSN